MFRRTGRITAAALLLAVALLRTGGVAAAEIVLERSAVDKLLLQTLFNRDGRYELLRGACFAYLDRPSAALREGRVRIRSYLTARLGVADGRVCRGIALASWTEVSGRPVPRGGAVVLTDLRVDHVDEPNLKWLLETGLVPALPGAVELDVLKAVRGMLREGGGPYATDVEAFAIDSVTAADDRLAVRFDFRLLAR